MNVLHSSQALVRKFYFVWTRNTQKQNCLVRQLCRERFSTRVAPRAPPLACSDLYFSILPERNHHGSSSSSCSGPSVRSTGPAVIVGAGLLLCAISSKDDETRFVVAAKEGDIDTLKSLLHRGVDINCRHPLGWTALHAAVVNQNWKVVKFLLEKGADMNVKDEFSSATRVAQQERVSPSKVAIVRDRDFSSQINHFTTAWWKYLLEKGADPNVENNRGLPPSKYTTNETTLSMMAEYAAKVTGRKERERLEERRQFPLEDQLRKSLVGQELAIKTVAAAIRRWELGWVDDEHPLVFLFLGSSGVGKTELAKQVARHIHKDEKGFIRLDMSEYQEKHEVAKMIGSPPGYIGHQEGGQLTSKLKARPNALVLFDEVDKAHPDVLTILLQLFDEGRLTDGQGKTIECRKAIFVMTSNLASEEIAAHALQLRREAEMSVAQKYRDSEQKKDVTISREFKENVVEPILKRRFLRDEFLGRINEIVYFLPFTRSELNELVEVELKKWQERTEKKHSIHLTWEREVLDIIADGYNVKYGARSLQHELERRVVNQLAAAYEQQIITKGDSVHLKVQNGDDGTQIKLQVTKGPHGEGLHHVHDVQSF
ncbi:hypothetical protein EMCRGX_G033756 [Ephydatia muelleri]